MQTRVILHNENITYKDRCVAYGNSQLGAEKLSGIWILTTDQGPFFDDVALALAFDDLTLIIPSEHSDHQSLFDSLSKDYAVNYSEYIKAMSSAVNARFVLWERVDNN